MFGAVCYRALLDRSLSGGDIGRGDVLPDRETVGHLGTPFGRRESVSARLFKYFDRRCLTEASISRCATW